MLDKLVSSSEQILPTTGFWGFLMHNWLAVALVIMVLGFAIDQTLYIVRYRPQDRWRSRWEKLRALLTGRAAPAEEGPVIRHAGAQALDAAAPVQKVDAPQEGPVIRRAGARYRPNATSQQEIPAAPRTRAATPARDAEEPEVFHPAPRSGVPRREEAPVAPRTRAAAPARDAEEPEVFRPAPRHSAPRPESPPQDNSFGEDEDAPLVVRAQEPMRPARSEEPITLRRNRPE